VQTGQVTTVDRRARPAPGDAAAHAGGRTGCSASAPSSRRDLREADRRPPASGSRPAWCWWRCRARDPAVVARHPFRRAPRPGTVRAVDGVLRRPLGDRLRAHLDPEPVLRVLRRLAGYYDADELIPARRRGGSHCSPARSRGRRAGRRAAVRERARLGGVRGPLAANNVLLTDRQALRRAAGGAVAGPGRHHHRTRAGARRERRPAGPTPRPGKGSGDRRRTPPAGRRDPRHHRAGPDRHHRPAAGRGQRTRPARRPQHVDRASDLARHSLGEARRSVQNLAPVGLEYDGLPEALRKTGRPMGRTDRRTAPSSPSPVRRSTCTVRSRRPSCGSRRRPWRTWPEARRRDPRRRDPQLHGRRGHLDIRDDGKGFDPLALPARTGTGGFGLDGMRARAERIAGSLTIESEPGFGTAVSARVPLVLHE
jgi:hypothetical protein